MNQRKKKKQKKKEIQKKEEKRRDFRNSFSEDTWGMSDEYLDIYIRTMRECQKRGMICTFSHGFIHIQSKFESWKFEPTNGKITLYHKNSISRKGKDYMDYHIQFRKWISIKDLITYIDEHARAKYTKEKVEFSIRI